MTTLLAHRTPRHEARTESASARYPRLHAPRIVSTEPQRYLAICGTQAPGGPEFEAAMRALYATAYGVVFRLRARGLEAHVRPSEALWERRNGEEGWSVGDEAFDPTAWHWTLLLPLPAGASDSDVHAASAAARARRPDLELDRVHVIELDEGLVVEAMHVGPYADEPATIETMRARAEKAGLEAHGVHHEIYLGDPRRTAPEQLRTVLRQQVRPVVS